MKNKYRDYDFADEIKDKGIIKKEQVFDGFIKRTTTVSKESLLKERIGTYLSFECDESVDVDSLINEISSSLKKILKIKKIKTDDLILCFGIGNEYYSSDALGPKTVKKIDPSTYISDDNKLKGLCSLIPGVKGITGLDSARIAKGIIKEYKVKAVIAIDSLVTHNSDRLFKVIQISDTGITPGGGLHSYLKSLNEKYLKVPVIAIGVATVLPTSALIESFINEIGQDFDENVLKTIENKIGEIENVYYTPKDTEDIIDRMSSILAKSIELTLKN